MIPSWFWGWLFLLTGPLISAWGMVWKASSQFQIDNENLLTTFGSSAGVSGLETSWGSFDLFGDYRQYEIEKNSLGLKNVSDILPGFRTRYAVVFGHYGLTANTGVSSLAGRVDPAFGTELSRYWSAGSQAVVRAKLSYLNQVDKGNPLMAVLALRSQSLALALNLTLDPWFFEVSAGEKFLSGANKSLTDKILTDTYQFQGLPRNRISSGYLYGYRNLGKWFLAGAFASYADSRHDFYAFLYRSPQDKSDTYMYFPYDTPLDAFAVGGVFACNLDLESMSFPMGGLSAKITFPFYSRHEQFYQIRSRFGIPMYEGYYTFHGDEPWTAELTWKKDLPGGMGMILGYKYFMKPYLEYGFFNSQGYRVHGLEITFSKF